MNNTICENAMMLVVRKYPTDDRYAESVMLDMAESIDSLRQSIAHKSRKLAESLTRFANEEHFGDSTPLSSSYALDIISETGKIAMRREELRRLWRFTLGEGAAKEYYAILSNQREKELGYSVKDE